MALAQQEKTKLDWITLEFLRRVVNELKGRQFEYREDHFVTPAPHRGDIVSAQTKQEDFLKVLPEITRQYAEKIKPEFTRCHKLQATYEHPRNFTASDPISGVSIRCTLIWNAIHSEMSYRFDAAFS